MATPLPTAPASAPRARLRRVHPQLFVDDILVVCAYYESALGFGTVFTYGTPPFYGQVQRDGLCLNLRCITPSPLDRELARRESLLAAYFEVENIEALYADVCARGAHIHQPLERAPWGMHEFVVADPSGNLVLFGESDGANNETTG